MGYKIEYSDDNVSAWGGFSVMKRFNDKLGLKQILNTLPIPKSTSNNRYETDEIIESFLLSVWLGCYKFSHTHVLRLDDTLKQIFEWKQIPSDTTYKRFFQKFNQGINNDVFPALQQWFFNQLVFDNYALDLDSTAITRYGNQEGNNIGYNPTKRFIHLGLDSDEDRLAGCGCSMDAQIVNTASAVLVETDLHFWYSALKCDNFTNGIADQLCYMICTIAKKHVLRDGISAPASFPIFGLTSLNEDDVLPVLHIGNRLILIAECHWNLN